MKSIVRLFKFLAFALLMFQTSLVGNAQKSNKPVSSAGLQFALGQSTSRIPFERVGNCCSNSYLTKEIYREKLAALRDNLGWANSSEMEKILIEQVCLNWLRLNLLESVHSTKTTESHSFETGVYWDKRLSSAQRRYLRAVESLAKVRKLLTEAELKEEQARDKRQKSAAVANKFLNNSPR